MNSYVLPTHCQAQPEAAGGTAPATESRAWILRLTSLAGCDFGQVLPSSLASPASSLGPSKCLDHISGFLSFRHRILFLNPILPGIPGGKMGKGEAALAF